MALLEYDEKAVSGTLVLTATSPPAGVWKFKVLAGLK
jgi:hypothetical protein